MVRFGEAFGVEFLEIGREVVYTLRVEELVSVRLCWVRGL